MTQALRELISEELRPLKEKMSKLRTDVSFLVNRIAECQFIMAEFPGLRKDINSCLEITVQLQKSVPEQGGNMGVVEGHLDVLDRCVGLPGAHTEGVAGSLRGDRGMGCSRRGLWSALEDSVSRRRRQRQVSPRRRDPVPSDSASDSEFASSSSSSQSAFEEEERTS